MLKFINIVIDTALFQQPFTSRCPVSEGVEIRGRKNFQRFKIINNGRAWREKVVNLLVLYQKRTT